ncbi:hypothetical protein [Desulfosporosinus sp. OT]|uniref:hypothetical protein n=1 Tax=Desulfosporosinus sp. OT TaxID=913865 RepID=UPI000223A08D|nr:hypothetical protein [Desulfosporosinus sp. OT]EGW36587.1 hypothetical protein DOT_5544 [Desulfosporosinus sp. OT]
MSAKLQVVAVQSQTCVVVFGLAKAGFLVLIRKYKLRLHTARMLIRAKTVSSGASQVFFNN